MTDWRILEGDCRDVLRSLPAQSVHTCVTSPPYFGLRDYGADGQIGLEPTPDDFVAALVAVFREVRRVLRDDGTVWLNLGDSYAGGGGYSPDSPSNLNGSKQTTQPGSIKGTIRPHGDVKAKDLLGTPWMVAFALRQPWEKHVIDDKGVAAEDMTCGDLNGDGRVDIVAVGRATHNVRIYWNQGVPGSAASAPTQSTPATPSR